MLECTANQTYGIWTQYFTYAENNVTWMRLPFSFFLLIYLYFSIHPSVVAFHPDIGRLQLLSAADDYKVRVWCLQSSTCIATLEAHYSRITAFQFSPEGSTLYTGGRDNIVAVWNTDNWNKHRIVPVYEVIYLPHWILVHIINVYHVWLFICSSHVF